MGQKKIVTKAMNLDGKRQKIILERNAGSSSEVYDIANDDPEHIYILNNERRPFIYDYFKLNVYTGKKETIAFGPSIGDMRGVATLGQVTDTDGYPLCILLDHGLERILYEYKKESKEWVEHFSFNCQEPGFVPIGTYKGQMVVSGSKFSPSGVLIEENDTNAIYLYDHKTKTFGDKLYQDPNYDVGGFTGTCRNASGGAGVDYDTRKLLYVTYEAQEPVKIYFDDEIAEIYNGLDAVFPNEWVSVVTRDKERNKMVIRVSSPSNPGDYYFYNRQASAIRSNYTKSSHHLCR